MYKMDEVKEKEIDQKSVLLMKTLGINIKNERIKHNMSRTELAYCAKTTESMICNIENGKKTGISIYTLVKISEALEIELYLFFL